MRISRRAVLAGMGATGAYPVLQALSLPAAFAQPARAPAAGGEWPCFRGPNRNGVSDAPLTLAADGPRKLWEAQVGSGNASMAIVNGRLYTFGGGRSDNLACLDARTGQVLWKRGVETHSGDPTPAVDAGRVYAMASLDQINAEGKRSVAYAYCCDAPTGNVVWKRELPSSTGDRQYGHAGSPLLWEDLVILNAGGGAAVKKGGGEIAWSHAGFPGLATPVLFGWRGRPAVALFGGDQLIARDARSGATLWSIPWKTELAVNACDPVCFDNKVFLCSGYGRGRSLYDISGAQPRVLWEFGEGGGSSFSSGFYKDGHLYCFAQGKFTCLDPGTGQPRWEAPGGVSALLVGGTLILVREAGEVFFARISPAGFQEIARADAGMRQIKSVPAYWDGRLYLRNEAGRILGLQIGRPG